MSDLLSNKMNEWEASPPPGAWEPISQHLQEFNAERKLSRRLLDYGEVPPTGTWQQISGAMQKDAPVVEIVPVRPLYPYLMRYAAAAAMIGFIVWFLSTSTLEGPKDLTTAALPLTEATAVPVTEPPSAAKPNTSIATQLADGSFINESPSSLKRRISRREPTHAAVKRNDAEFAYSPSEWTPEIAQHIYRLFNRKLPVQQSDMRYINVSSANGAPVRLSAKYAHVYLSLTEGTGTEPASQQSFRKLEQQLLNTLYVPDPGNLFDLLQLQELLQEN